MFENDNINDFNVYDSDGIEFCVIVSFLCLFMLYNVGKGNL